MGEIGYSPPRPAWGFTTSRRGREVRAQALKESDANWFRLFQESAFAMTRWTNLYFPVRFGLFGDFVAGPLGGLLGQGIMDIPVTTMPWYYRRTPLSHLAYWRKSGGNTNSDVLVSLVNAIDLNAETLGIPRGEFRD